MNSKKSDLDTVLNEMTAPATKKSRKESQLKSSATASSRKGRAPGTFLSKKDWLEKQEVITRERDLPLLRDYRSNYSLEEILSAVLAYTLTANASEAERLTGVKSATIRQWKHQAVWWDEAVEYCRKANQEQLDARFTRIIHRAAERLESKLNSDVEMDETTISQLAQISSTFFKDRNLLRGEATNISRKDDKEVETHMAGLLQGFEQMSRDIRDRLPPSKTIEGELIDAQSETKGHDPEQKR